MSAQPQINLITVVNVLFNVLYLVLVCHCKAYHPSMLSLFFFYLIIFLIPKVPCIFLLSPKEPCPIFFFPFSLLSRASHHSLQKLTLPPFRYFSCVEFLPPSPIIQRVLSFFTFFVLCPSLSSMFLFCLLLAFIHSPFGFIPSLTYALH